MARLNKPLLNVTFDIRVNVVFNLGMDTAEHPDWQLILELGGPTKVAEMLNLPREGGVQRVQNWKTRGIPAAVKLDHPKLFPRKRKASPKTANNTNEHPQGAH